MFNKFISFCKNHWAGAVSLVFIWVIPIIMLNETVALYKVNIAFKLTFIGCLVALVAFFSFRKKIYAIIHKQPHGIIRGVLLCVHKAVTYGLCLGVLWALQAFSTKIYNWWLLAGISIAIGLIFIVVDEILMSKKITKDGK